MNKEKNLYIVFLDTQNPICGEESKFIFEVLEFLRLKVFKNEAIKLSQNSLLLVTNIDNEKDYPDINHFIENSMSDLIANKFPFVQISNIKYFIIKADGGFKRKLFENRNKFMEYLKEDN